MNVANYIHVITICRGASSSESSEESTFFFSKLAVDNDLVEPAEEGLFGIILSAVALRFKIANVL